MRIELLIRKDERQPAGAVRGCAAGFVAVVTGILLMLFSFTGNAFACGDPPGPGCPSACDTWDPVQEKCIEGCQCPCAECDEDSGYCYEDCPIGESCCCSADNSRGQCYQHDEYSCCDGRLCELDECKTCVDGVCENRCTYYYADWCMICDGTGNCIDRCDPDLCQWCDGYGNCEFCGGNPDKTCRNGNCCSAPNGCGPEGGPPVPDNPTGCEDTSFLGPCNAHDDCYGTCGSNKDTCDEDFWEGMMEVCSMAASDCVAACTQNANIYYNAVSGWGQSAWESAQACSCG